ncbi:hypothetical protein Ddye_028409 [Dipteronia dyeriana]|uniref:Uncharacterized protein n=1 Tax=Dipteronia dyeriana TaxID=168575 RepID=A0AAD9TQW4_9ROSI|nr:hypothetical protein Ddye_028409 [Dipteronia dyeriana]
MARKKSNHKANDTEQDNTTPQDQKKQNQTLKKTLVRQPTMEDDSEKFQNLKDLNTRLVKQNMEKRQQVETLVHSKAAMEAELIKESDKNVCLEIEEGLFRFLVRTQMGEMGAGFDGEKSEREYQIRVLKSEVNVLVENLENERGRLSQARIGRDLMKSDLDCQVKEANGFKERLFEMERQEIDLKDEVLMLRNENDGLVKEKNERDTDVEALKKEKGLVERKLMETLKEIDDLKCAMDLVVREKKEIEMETSDQKVKIDELGKELLKLNEIIVYLQKEEKALHKMGLELEKSYSEAVDKGEEMASEIDVLRGEKNEKQSSIEKLMVENEDVLRRLEAAMLGLNDKEGQIKKLLRGKNEIEEMKISQETEVVELRKEVEESRETVSALKELCRDARNGLNEEKKNGLDLKYKISEMEKKIEDKVKELSKIRNEHGNVVVEKKKMEERIELLMKEKESVQKNLSEHIELLKKEKESVQKDLLEAQRGVDDMRAKMDSFGINYDRTLSLLKSTAALVCQSRDEVDGKPDVVVKERKLDFVTDPYAAQLEVIKNAFGDKEKLVGDMKKQVEFLQNSVEEAHKKKSFWTLVSSATTLFAAASVAYAARIR